MNEHTQWAARTRWTGLAILALGLATMSVSFWTTTSGAGAGVTIGLGAMTVIFAAWSLIARDPTKDHWSLTVVGLALLISPWVGQFAGDGASWMAWIAGALIMLIASAAYLRDEAIDITAETARKDDAAYQASIA